MAAALLFLLPVGPMGPIGAARAAEPPACPGPRVPVATIDGWLDDAEQAFADLDIDRFLVRSDRVRAALPCLDAVLPRRVAARLHRIEGLRRFGERRVDSVRSFAAARALEPDYAFDPRLVPPDHPILDDYAAMDLAAADPEVLPRPVHGAVFVDGVRTRHRARAWPAVVQVVGTTGVPAMTAWVEHHQPVPSYPSRRRPGRTAVGIAAVGLAATSGAALTGAWVAHDAWTGATTEAQLRVLRAHTNTLTTVSVVSGGAALGLGTALVLTW